VPSDDRSRCTRWQYAARSAGRSRSSPAPRHSVFGLAACSGGGSSSGGKVQISFLTANGQDSTKEANDFIAAFERSTPISRSKLNQQPVGSEGDNLIKTKLSTGEMEMSSSTNTGSLLQALRPDKTLVDLTDQPWVSQVTDDFKSTVTAGTRSTGTARHLVRRRDPLQQEVYKQLGLTVPTSWADFMANSEKIKQQDPSVAPIIQAYGDDYTAQIWLLADFANVAHQDPQWATKYTQHKVKYTSSRPWPGSCTRSRCTPPGFSTRTSRRSLNDQALTVLADGKGA